MSEDDNTDGSSSDVSTDSDGGAGITAMVYEKYTMSEEEGRAKLLIDAQNISIAAADSSRRRREQVAGMLRSKLTADNCREVKTTLEAFMTDSWEPPPVDDAAEAEEKGASQDAAESKASLNKNEPNSASARQMLSRVQLLRRTVNTLTDEKDDLVKEMRQYKKKETDSQARIKKLEAEVNALQESAGNVQDEVERNNERMHDRALDKFSMRIARRQTMGLFRDWLLYVSSRKRCRRLLTRLSADQSVQALSVAWQSWLKLLSADREKHMQHAYKVVGSWMETGGSGTVDIDDALTGTFNNIAKICGTVDGLESGTGHGVTLTCTINVWCDEKTAEFKQLTVPRTGTITLCGDGTGWVNITEPDADLVLSPADAWSIAALDEVGSNPYFRLRRL